MEKELKSSQISMFTAKQNPDSTANTFDCCSRYRACSDMKRCLIPDLDYSRGCNYRKQLEAGTIFYGKNSNEYRPDVYNELKKKYDSLTEIEANTLCEVLNYCFIEKAGRYRVMVFENPVFASLAKYGFFHLTMYPEKVVKKCTVDALISACGSHIMEADRWAESQYAPEEWTKRKIRNKKLNIKIRKDELVKWILKFSPETVSALIKGICFIEINMDIFRELDELFRDFMQHRKDIPVLKTCESDPRFLATSR